jgi:poly-gamma-glutamate synthesis protein (capsule biosynthesis protein)
MSVKKLCFLVLFFLCIGSIYSGVIRKPKKFRVLFAGDVMFDWGLRETMQSRGFFSPIEGLVSIFEEVDFRMVNLETAVSTSDENIDKSKAYVFNAKPEELTLLKRLQIDGVFLANNHSMDYGKKGLEETISNLQANSIQFVGAGPDLNSSYAPLIFPYNNINLQIFSASAIGEARLFATPKTPGAAPYNLKKLLTLPTKKSGTIPILALHWGIEYRPEPTGDQIQAAHSLIDSGFKVIVGHHPHIPQGIEKYKDGIIIYSLGNFIFGSRNPYLNHNLAVILHFREDKIALCEIVPVFGKFQKEEHFVRPLQREEGNEFLVEIAYLSKKLGTEIEIKNGRGYIHFE